MDQSIPSSPKVREEATYQRKPLKCLDLEDLYVLQQCEPELPLDAASEFYAELHMTFTEKSFQSDRLEALKCIGHHVQHLTFSMPHHPHKTFLPPLINEMGAEIDLLYTPNTSLNSKTHHAKFDTDEDITNLLIHQYNPIFHAAICVSSFIRALECMPNLRHITISTPGQDPKERYRRSAVDYALMSLRIAIERAPLRLLRQLSLDVVHPAAFLYLRHTPAFGGSPASGRRWRQIKKLEIKVESWSLRGSHPGFDQLKIIDDFILGFAPNLYSISVDWVGRKGPCLITLGSSPQFSPSIGTKLFNEVTTPMSPLPALPARPMIHFPKLRSMRIQNSIISTEQLRTLIDQHCKTVRKFYFSHIFFLNDGLWSEVQDFCKPLLEKAKWKWEVCDEYQHNGLDSPSEGHSGSKEISQFITLKKMHRRHRGREERRTEPERPPKTRSRTPTRTSPQTFEALLSKVFPEISHLSPSKLFRSHSFGKSNRSNPLLSADGTRLPISRPYPCAQGLRPHISLPTLREPFTFAPAVPTRPSTDPLEEMLQPRTFVPNVEGEKLQPATFIPNVQEETLQPTTFIPKIRGETLQPKTFDPNVQGVQRNFGLDEAQEKLAFDEEEQTLALRKAKDAVLTKLGSQFSKKAAREPRKRPPLNPRSLETAGFPLMVFR